MVLPPSTHEVAPGVELDHAWDRLAWYATVARLAPSKHNSQPWRFVVSDHDLAVWPDLTRRLSASDPRDRELVMACGAAVETAHVAAGALGVRLEVVAWPEGESGPAARLREVGRNEPTPEAHALLGAVSRRRTDRGPLDAGALPASLPFVLDDVAATHGCSLRQIRSQGDKLTLARVIDIADRQLARQPEIAQEVEQWVRLSRDAASDGVPADATRGRQGSYAGAFVQRDFSLPDVAARHDRPGVDDPLVVVLSTPGDDGVHWLQGGRALMAVLLAATAVGGNASYLNQPLELQHTRDLLRTDFDLDGHPQVVLRIGAGGAVDAPPRRPIEDVVARNRT